LQLTWGGIFFISLLALLSFSLFIEIVVLFIVDILFIFIRDVPIRISQQRTLSKHEPEWTSEPKNTPPGIWGTTAVRAGIKFRQGWRRHPQAQFCAALRRPSSASSPFRILSHHTNNKKDGVGRVLRRMGRYLLLLLLITAGQGDELLLLLLLSLAAGHCGKWLETASIGKNMRFPEHGRV
jgi:hypothetical protein